MGPLEPSGPNAEQIQYWNDLAGQKWVALQNLIDSQLRPLGRQVMDRVVIGSGERVIDIGCGCGDSTLDLAHRVGPTGQVLGIDLSTAMLARARQAAQEAGAAHARFENADAQTHTFVPESFDVLFSRFGIMFFAHPEDAFANLRTALRSGGRLGFVCWQTLQNNPWMLVPLGAALQHLPPPDSFDPNAPGPFAFADPERVWRILTGAGFSAVEIEPLEETLTVGGGGDLDQAVDLMLQMGPTARLLREGDPALRPVVADAVRAALAPYHTADGVRMASAAWIVTGRRV